MKLLHCLVAASAVTLALNAPLHAGLSVQLDRDNNGTVVISSASVSGAPDGPGTAGAAYGLVIVLSDGHRQTSWTGPSLGHDISCDPTTVNNMLSRQLPGITTTVSQPYPAGTYITCAPTMSGADLVEWRGPSIPLPTWCSVSAAPATLTWVTGANARGPEKRVDVKVSCGAAASSTLSVGGSTDDHGTATIDEHVRAQWSVLSDGGNGSTERIVVLSITPETLDAGTGEHTGGLVLQVTYS